MKKVILRILGGLIASALAVAGWWLLIDTRPPAKRPDLVRVPDSLGPPPAGYPTENALLAKFVLQELGLANVDLIDVEGPIPVPEGVREETDIVYGMGGDTELKLDLYSPKNLSGPVPGMIFIHGGGWSSGKRQDYKIYTTKFAEQGYVVATVTYRLREAGYFPNCVEDVKCAVRWMRKHAKKLNVDPNRIAVIGGSAGGHLSMMVGYSSDVSTLEGTGGHEGVSSAVQAVIDLYGPADFSIPPERNHRLITTFLQGRYEDNIERYVAASPITYVDPSDPPTLIFHGTVDTLVPVRQSDRLAEKFQELGMDYWYDRIDGWPHAMDVAQVVNDRVVKVVSAFLEETFAKPVVPVVPTALENMPDLSR
ncbi:MAG: alpha/beta hydrolase [Candidatus Hydrogenedentes bacterium]|nr:alpha/beta hydrolase [Candidatus Hydrogenedentota bacterium]